jgi:hypothetical protein
VGTWGIEPFENDDASDWAWELEEGDLRSQLFAAVAAAADWPADELMETAEGANAVAAAQVIAHLLGREPLTHTEELTAVLEARKFTPYAELIQEALAALERVQAEQSELEANWQESEDYAEWKASLVRIRGALAG